MYSVFSSKKHAWGASPVWVDSRIFRWWNIVANNLWSLEFAGFLRSDHNKNNWIQCQFCGFLLSVETNRTYTLAGDSCDSTSIMIRGNMSSPDEPTVQSMSGTQLPLPWALLRRGRQLYGLYFFLGGCFKVLIGLLWSDTLKSMFLERLLDIPAETFAHEYLTSFAIPNAFLVAYVLTLGELCVGLLFMLNVFAKWGAVLAIFHHHQYRYRWFF